MSAAEDWAQRNVTTHTLADLGYKLEIECRSCRHCLIAEPYELRRMFPAPTPLDQAAHRLRCKGCGAHEPQMWVWVMGWTRDKRRRR